MPSETLPLRRQIIEIAHLLARHVFLPINAIIFSVVILLVLFGNTQEGMFLCAIVAINIVMGFVQDVRAWITLERLQLLTAFRILRINPDGSETNVLLQDIRKNDTLRLSLGDQVPCDGELISTAYLEVSEGLITGESDSFARKPKEILLAGSVVTAGSGIIRAKTSFSESAISKMTEGLKRYTANPSPIQISIQRIIQYTVLRTCRVHRYRRHPRTSYGARICRHCRANRRACEHFSASGARGCRHIAIHIRCRAFLQPPRLIAGSERDGKIRPYKESVHG